MQNLNKFSLSAASWTTRPCSLPSRCSTTRCTGWTQQGNHIYTFILFFQCVKRFHISDEWMNWQPRAPSMLAMDNTRKLLSYFYILPNTTITGQFCAQHETVSLSLIYGCLSLILSCWPSGPFWFYCSQIREGQVGDSKNWAIFCIFSPTVSPSFPLLTVKYTLYCSCSYTPRKI